jgi:hypothetical protein
MDGKDLDRMAVPETIEFMSMARYSARTSFEGRRK